MTDKAEVLAGLDDVFRRWEALLADLTEAQVAAPLAPSDWCIKDVMVHLWAWQGRTVARTEAAVRGGEPQFPAWPAGLDPEDEADVQQINAWVYATHRDQPWPSVHAAWRAGFRRLLDLGEQVAAQDLAAVGRYPWLPDYSLAVVLDASREHHEEHIQDLLAWREQQTRA